MILPDAPRSLDHVVVGQDVAVLAQHESRAGAGRVGPLDLDRHHAGQAPGRDVGDRPCRAGRRTRGRKGQRDGTPVPSAHQQPTGDASEHGGHHGQGERAGHDRRDDPGAQPARTTTPEANRQSPARRRTPPGRAATAWSVAPRPPQQVKVHRATEAGARRGSRTAEGSCRPSGAWWAPGQAVPVPARSPQTARSPGRSDPQEVLAPRSWPNCPQGGPPEARRAKGRQQGQP